MLPTSLPYLLLEILIVLASAVLWSVVFETEYVEKRVLNTIIYSLMSSAIGFILTGVLAGHSVFREPSRIEELAMTSFVILPELAIASIVYVIKIFVERE